MTEVNSTGKYFSLFLCIALALLLGGCNDDVFVDRLEISPSEAELGPTCRSVTIDVSTSGFSVTEIAFHDRSGMTYYNNDVPDEIVTPFTHLAFRVSGRHITVTLDKCLGAEDAELTVTLTDGYTDCRATLAIHPTDSYDIRIADVRYNTESWGEYPDRSFSSLLQRREFPSCPEAFTVDFDPVSELPVMYRFVSYSYEDELFVQQVLNSGVKVPVPSYVRNIDPRGPYWRLDGQTAALYMTSHSFRTGCLPPMPAAVTIQAGRSVAVGLTAAYACFEVQGEMSVTDPFDGKVRDIIFGVEMVWPVKLFSTVSEL